MVIGNASDFGHKYSVSLSHTQNRFFSLAAGSGFDVLGESQVIELLTAEAVRLYLVDASCNKSQWFYRTIALRRSEISIHDG